MLMIGDKDYENMHKGFSGKGYKDINKVKDQQRYIHISNKGSMLNGVINQ